MHFLIWIQIWNKIKMRGGGGIEQVNFFTKNPNLKKIGEGGRGRWTDRPKPICPFNFFEVGGITMNKYTSYGPDKLNLWPFYHLTFKCNLDLQPTWTALLLLEDSNCARLFWNPCTNVQLMARTSSIYKHFDIYLTPVTLTFNLPEKLFQSALFLLEGNNCANYYEIHK